jgi:hypothetical protein
MNITEDPASFVRELSANPTCNCALYYIVSKLGGKIIIPLEELKYVKLGIGETSYLTAYYDADAVEKCIVLQIV